MDEKKCVALQIELIEALFLLLVIAIASTSIGPEDLYNFKGPPPPQFFSTRPPLEVGPSCPFIFGWSPSPLLLVTEQTDFSVSIYNYVIPGPVCSITKVSISLKTSWRSVWNIAPVTEQDFPRLHLPLLDSGTWVFLTLRNTWTRATSKLNPKRPHQRGFAELEEINSQNEYQTWFSSGFHFLSQVSSRFCARPVLLVQQEWIGTKMNIILSSHSADPSLDSHCVIKNTKRTIASLQMVTLKDFFCIDSEKLELRSTSQ